MDEQQRNQPGIGNVLVGAGHSGTEVAPGQAVEVADSRTAA
jgi:hypothetical protein